ncbi:hypothetical protein [Methylomonas sp. CM2]|uniref:hypothetical protein n=1 Tax=Methylomonas sp. CM2 TaxID=3417647 RepID=UPI003CF628E1
MICLAIAAPAAAREFEFLYIEANEGSASGGHAALRLDDAVYHFQHVEPGWLRLYRDDFAAFRFAYGFQENRAIYRHHIAVSEVFFQDLQQAFSRTQLIQTQHFDRLRALAADRDLLQGLLEPEEVRPSLALKALGYFLERYRPAQAMPADRPSPRLAALRQLAADRYGADFLAAKRRRIREQLHALTPARPAQNPPISAERFEVGELSFGQRYEHQLLNLAALDVLQAGLSPRPETLLQARLPELALNAAQIRTLESFRENLIADLLALLDSRRPDWGYPLLVGMARLHALDASIASGELTVLDRSLQRESAPALAEADLPAALQYGRALLAAASRRLTDGEALDERGYAEIERGATALLQVAEPGRQTPPKPLAVLTATPATPAAAELLSLPLAPEALAAELALAERRLTEYRAQLTELYRYDLLGRNCVTELFRMLNATVGRTGGARSAEALADASRTLLGGYLDDSGANRIPFAAYDSVGASYRVVASERLPPYRERQLNRQYQTEPVWRVALRESNALTSTVYAWHGDDAVFVFFTQDAVWPRPLQAGFNLAAAGGQAALGLLSWPWDSGRNLRNGLKGAAVSLPELVFFNIRKGSFPGLLPDADALADAAAE